MIRTLLLAVLLFLGNVLPSTAGEGMWIPLLIEKYRIDSLRAEGCTLEAEDIFSINRECLNDAIVRFGRGCTGELISPEGLLLTNHHCGESHIQFHSTVDNDLLTHGFWAGSGQEELPCPGLTVTFLRYMEDVTMQIVNGLEPGMDPDEKERVMDLNRGKVIREAVSGTELDAEVKSFYQGNRHYLFVYERFTDIRLVGAPSGAVGDFGGDTDNWMWPRHTGDFSLFRVYAGSENQPADYDPSNRPYRPRKHLEVSLDGVESGDFTMVLGYPATTYQYLHSGAIRSLQSVRLPLKVSLRTTRLEIMDRYMNQSDTIRIQYAHKHSRVSNYKKKWQGVLRGFERYDLVEMKRWNERDFLDWVTSDDLRILKYGDLMAGFEGLYLKKEELSLAMDLMSEAVFAVELFTGASAILGMMWRGEDAVDITEAYDRFYRDFHAPLDRDVFASVMESYRLHMPEKLHPRFFKEVNERYAGDFQQYAGTVYAESYFSNRDRFTGLMELYKKDLSEAIDRSGGDPAMVLFDQFLTVYGIHVYDRYEELRAQEDILHKRYQAALLERYGEGIMYPEANRTLRLSSGKVEGYEPQDGIEYLPFSTAGGLLEKTGSGHPEYVLPERLKDLIRKGDFGIYGVNGSLPVCFLASNHTSGGNSGSPVLDAEGRLIGLNFDRVWEGTVSDYYYDPDQCRSIAVDIRYILFIIDRYAKAGHLIDEMDIYRSNLQ